MRKELIIKKIPVIVTRKHLNSLKSKVHEAHDPMNNVKSNHDNSVNIGVESNQIDVNRTIRSRKNEISNVTLVAKHQE